MFIAMLPPESESESELDETSLIRLDGSYSIPGTFTVVELLEMTPFSAVVEGAFSVVHLSVCRTIAAERRIPSAGRPYKHEGA